ncbi:hypothetical protein [Nocardioides sp. R-C-SC26]|uniref:hypothetical protein n=1 Tax=Nocardioides sp. R-C-SC26 TaxID=2870414 RepID=UPI001E5D2BE2|nr:hypothetical protein [Nocardioides sp. R-C-SC26]
MTPHTSAYDDLATPEEMRADCRSLDGALQRAIERISTAPPSLHFDDQPAERGKPTIQVSAATAHLVAAIYGD